MWNDSKLTKTNPEDHELASQWRARRGPSSEMEAHLVAEFRVEIQARKGSRYIWWSLTAAAAIAVIGLSFGMLHRAAPPEPLARLLSTTSVPPTVVVQPEERPTPTVKQNAMRKLPKQAAPAVPTTLASNRESYTEFFPISNNFSRDQLDRSQVIRVQLPRSALFTIGMPVDVNRLDETIKADLVMGEDGFARAVRFVQ